jgi:uncharacterized lipoprotein YehR (DUF1307 family)
MKKTLILIIALALLLTFALAACGDKENGDVIDNNDGSQNINDPNNDNSNEDNTNVFLNPDSKDFARAFGMVDDPNYSALTLHWDTGKEKIKFETVFDEQREWYVVEINGNKADVPFTWYKQVFIMDDIIIFVTVGSDIRSTDIYIVDFNGNALFKTYYLNNKGMVIDGYISTDGNKIIMSGTRTTHGVNLVMTNTNESFSEYSDYLYQDTVYEYENIEYKYDGSQVHLFNGTVFSEASGLLNKDEIIEAVFELEYLGDGKLGKIKMTDDFITLGEYLKKLI